MKRKIISILAILVLVLSLSLSASADSAQYKSTNAFIRAMENNGYSYDYYPTDEDYDNEMIQLKFEGEYYDTVDIVAFFPDTEDEVILCSFDIIAFDESRYQELLEVVNQLNNDLSYCSFYIDKTYYTVCGYWNVLLGETDAEEISDIAFHSFLNAVDYSYSTLAPYEVSVSYGSQA